MINCKNRGTLWELEENCLHTSTTNHLDTSELWIFILVVWLFWSRIKKENDLFNPGLLSIHTAIFNTEPKDTKRHSHNLIGPLLWHIVCVLVWMHLHVYTNNAALSAFISQRASKMCYVKTARLVRVAFIFKSEFGNVFHVHQSLKVIAKMGQQ